MTTVLEDGGRRAGFARSWPEPVSDDSVLADPDAARLVVEACRPAPVPIEIPAGQTALTRRDLRAATGRPPQIARALQAEAFAVDERVDGWPRIQVASGGRRVRVATAVVQAAFGSFWLAMVSA